MKLKFKTQNYDIYLKALSPNEKNELIKRICIIPKTINTALSIYIDNFLYYLNDMNEVVCLKSESDKKEIICLKLEYDKEDESVRCIGIEISNHKNRINLIFIVLKDLNQIIEDNKIDANLLLHPILISFI